jgi:hypothetical protein
MTRRTGPVWLSLLIVLPGCLPTSETSLIPSAPFGSGLGSTSRLGQDAPAPAATTEAAVTVGRVGLKVVSANPSLGLQPRFITIGGESAPLELFHTGDADVFITETLARKCKTEGELAALLSTELGRIVSERSTIRLNEEVDRGPPPAVDIGNDHGGSFGAADGTRMMELAKYERKRALAREQAAPPAPDVLARAFLQKTGYNPADLDAVSPLLRATEGGGKLEKLMTVSGPN